jgi:DNA-binding IclR family transcriptional regulator
LLDYVASARLEYIQRGPRPPLTVAEPARLLKIDPQSCRRALHTLTVRGEIQTTIRPGARYEPRLGRRQWPG